MVSGVMQRMQAVKREKEICQIQLQLQLLVVLPIPFPSGLGLYLSH